MLERVEEDIFHLVAARSKVAKAFNDIWLGAHADTGAGDGYTDPRSSDAVSWTAYGALMTSAFFQSDLDRLERRLMEHATYKGEYRWVHVDNWVRHEKKGQKDVVLLFDKALSRAWQVWAEDRGL